MENNFKTIKDSVTRLIFESVNTGDSKLNHTWKKFVNEINNSPVLKTLYVVYNNIENNKFDNKDVAEIFLNENLLSFAGFSKSQIINENVKFKNLINEHLIESDKDDLFELILESTKDRKLSNLNKKAELFNTVVESLVKENSEICETIEPVDQTVINRAIEILNEKYSFFNETEKNILKAFLKNDETQKEEYYNALVNENLNIIKRLIIESENEDSEEYELLKLTESKLNNLKYDSSIGIEKFSELINLKK